MSDIPDMTPMSLATAAAPRKGKIIKNGLRVFERGDNLLQSGMLHFGHFLVIFTVRGATSSASEHSFTAYIAGGSPHFKG